MEKLVSMQSKGALEAWVYEVGEQYRVVVKRLGIEFTRYITAKSVSVLKEPFKVH